MAAGLPGVGLAQAECLMCFAFQGSHHNRIGYTVAKKILTLDRGGELVMVSCG
jgi:hypothetical protein